VFILVLIIFKHSKYTMRKNCVDMCARDDRGAIEAKKTLENTGLGVSDRFLDRV